MTRLSNARDRKQKSRGDWPYISYKKIQTHTCLVSSYKQSGPGLQLTAVYSEDLPGNGRFSGSFLYISLVSLSVGDEALKKPNMSVAPGKPGPYKLFKGTQTQKDRLSVTRLFFSFISSGDSRRRKDKGLCLAFPLLFLAPVSSGSRRLFITV